MSTDLNSPVPVGWLPIDIILDARPAMVSEGIVHWMELGSTPLAEPFFSHTVERLRKGSTPAREWDTNVDALLRLTAGSPSVRPAGFIFHISRCGSTLVSNSMKAAEGTVVISESPALAKPLLPHARLDSVYLQARWNDRRRALLNSLFALVANYRTGQPERLVIKFPSISTLSMKLVRECWPDVPCLVIVRDPVEVIVANLPGGGWMELKDSPSRAEEFFDFESGSVAGMAREEYAARVVGRLMERALEAPPDLCQVVDYEDLTERRICQIGTFFGLKLPETEEKMQMVLSHYAKDPRTQRRFEDDRARKQQLVTAQIRRAAQQWAMPAYSNLRSRC